MTRSLVGVRFNRLEVLGDAESSVAGHARWRCVCDCGTETTVLGYNLKNGNTTSCGCRQRELREAYYRPRTSQKQSDHYDRFYAPDAKAFYMADVPLCDEGED